MLAFQQTRNYCKWQTLGLSFSELFVSVHMKDTSERRPEGSEKKKKKTGLKFPLSPWTLESHWKWFVIIMTTIYKKREEKNWSKYRETASQDNRAEWRHKCFQGTWSIYEPVQTFLQWHFGANMFECERKGADYDFSQTSSVLKDTFFNVKDCSSWTVHLRLVGNIEIP